MLHIDPDTFLPFLIFAIPIVAIVGGITAGIVRTLGNQRLMELAQRERIAAIERGVDPSKLPPLPVAMSDRGGWTGGAMFVSYHDYAKRRAQGLMVGGLVALFVGIALSVFLRVVNGGEEGAWAVGLIPAAVGAALILSSFIVRPRDERPGNPPTTPVS